MEDKQQSLLKNLKIAYKLLVLILGLTIVLFGVVLLVFPGPGLVVIFIGLGLLATEFVWARHLMNRIRTLSKNKLSFLKNKKPQADHPNPVTHGLTTQEARERQKVYGKNEISVKSTNGPIKILWGQFKSLFILILIVAAILSFFIGEVSDTLAIIIIVILNAVLGFFQEWRAEKALDSLKSLLVPEVNVLRDGNLVTIHRHDLVPGDWVMLEAGDQVPADLKIMESVSCEVDESILTGESHPVEKNGSQSSSEQADLWMGTLLTQGSAKAEVCQIGHQTRFGQVSHLTAHASQVDTPLTRSLSLLSIQLGYLAAVVAAFILLLGWWQGDAMSEVLMTALALVVAVVPEGLPLVVTLSLAFGIHRFVKKGVLVRKLQSVEALGRVSVICSDKTGTLTVNQMTVVEGWNLETLHFQVSGEGYEPEGEFFIGNSPLNVQKDTSLIKMLECSHFCNRSHIVKNQEGLLSVIGSPTEGALRAFSEKSKMQWPNLSQIVELPFTSDKKRMSVVMGNDNDFFIYTKGAPDVLIHRVSHYHRGKEKIALGIKEKALISESLKAMSEKGLRVILLAGQTMQRAGETLPQGRAVDENLTFYGLVGLIDPPREEVKTAISECQRSGIDVSVITGDGLITAKAICRRIGLDVAKEMGGEEIDQISDQELKQILSQNKNHLFYRTQPQHKLRIVHAFQRLDQVVAMTGDGVNDAPALKASDVGVSMGAAGTDVAKQASDIVLMDDSFATLVEAVKEGRREFDNIKKFVLYLLSSNVGEIFAVVGSLIFQGPLVLSAIQILWVNLVTDGISAISLSFEKEEDDLMDRKPRKANESFLDIKSTGLLFIVGLYIGLVTLGIFYHYFGSQDPETVAKAGTMSFSTLVFLELINLFNFQSLRKTAFSGRLISNWRLLLFTLLSFLIHLTCIYTSWGQSFFDTQHLNGNDWLLISLLSFPIIFVVEIYKFFAKPRKINGFHS